MLWALLSALLVLGIRLFTVYRLRGLKKRVEVNTPKLEKLHIDLSKQLAEVKAQKSQEAQLQARLNHLKDVVRTIEVNLKKPILSEEDKERAEMLAAEDAL